MIIDSKSPSLEEMVYSRLEEEILTGELSHGTSLGEIALAKRLGVSRTPIRGALHRLAEEGLVEISPNRGAVVVGVTVDDLIDTYKIRVRLEGLASAMAASRMTNEEKEELRESVELAEYYVAKGNAEKLKELDTEFHNIIYRASGNRMLSRILSELHRNIKTYRKLSMTVPGRVERTAEEHREILNAILAGDVEKADTLTRMHVERAMENMVEAMKSKE